LSKNNQEKNEQYCIRNQFTGMRLIVNALHQLTHWASPLHLLLADN